MFEGVLEKIFMSLLMVGFIVIFLIFYMEKNKGVGCVIVYSDDDNTYLICDPVKDIVIGDTIKDVRF